MILDLFADNTGILFTSATLPLHMRGMRWCKRVSSQGHHITMSTTATSPSSSTTASSIAPYAAPGVAAANAVLPKEPIITPISSQTIAARQAEIQAELNKLDQALKEARAREEMAIQQEAAHKATLLRADVKEQVTALISRWELDGKGPQGLVSFIVTQLDLSPIAVAPVKAKSKASPVKKPHHTAATRRPAHVSKGADRSDRPGNKMSEGDRNRLLALLCKPDRNISEISRTMRVTRQTAHAYLEKLRKGAFKGMKVAA